MAGNNEIIKMMQALFSEQKNDLNELKKEIQKQGCIYDKKLSDLETRLGEIELENEKVINKLKSNKDDRVSSSGNDNLNNELTSNNLSLIHI